MVKVAVIYVCPVAMFGEHYFQSACQFSASWMQFSAGHPCDLYVVSNGGPPDSRTKGLFSLLNAKFLEHDDTGYDIGAYQLAARTVQCDLMVFLGGSSYLRGNDWLARIVASFVKYGRALYGSMGHTGSQPFGILPHIRTTGFWMPPQLLNQYPTRVVAPSQRYPFEHGPDCLTSWVRKIGLKAWVIGWKAEQNESWETIENGYHNGTQHDLIIGDRLSAPPYYPYP